MKHLHTVRKLDLWLLPFLSLMYFFNSIDRVSITLSQPKYPFSSVILQVIFRIVLKSDLSFPAEQSRKCRDRWNGR